ncbi:leucyl aminopeptidase [Roseateles oligotrophus]|uniref:Probable cytosol aminopeptidase n=1 Tax=Roseateles oligotrophus TaxID=1769250 RepID=A0ABT2YF76_9BURK|nr:leucyl aminopeptidase [Roseateles oligotrophus]MCV2368707.1 leucyl aminopeptidase [Roseateles oligotrophus]
MDFRTQTASFDALAGINADALILLIAGEDLPSGMDAAMAALTKDALKLGDFELKAGKAIVLQRPAGVKAPRLILAAAGKPTLKAARAALQLALAQLKGRGAVHAAVAFVGFDAMTESLAEQFVLAASDSAYLYRHTKPSAPASGKLDKLTLIIDKADAAAAKVSKIGLARGQAIGAGIELARECANRPGNYATPTFLGEQVKALGRTHGLKVEVLDQKAVEKLGMGSFLSVAQGSDEPLRFIVARYEGAAKTQAPVVLVGKGITFDSGGISLKPGAEMDEMKFDMGGAASVIGALRAVAELKPKLNLVAIIAACENMPSGRALKPGDVVTSMSGQTIEILNTDAEGRLVLCDALTYAERFKPAVVVDVATLTGACVIALGGVRSGMYASDDELAASLSAAGEAALDPCWRMPLDDEYEEGLKSNFADVANVGSRAGGSITAAKFLQRFAGKFRWGHLDIAGTAWKGGAAKGGTGRPVGLLTHFVLSQAR